MHGVRPALTGREHKRGHARAGRDKRRLVHLRDEVLQHFSYVEVRNDAVFQRANGLDITWRTTQHALCIFTHRRNGFLVALLAIATTEGSFRTIPLPRV